MEDRRRHRLELDLLRSAISISFTTAPPIRVPGIRSSDPATTNGHPRIFARRPETGEAIWAYQINPHDEHDYDAVNENILLDLNIKGQQRKVLAHPDRNARMYIMDRATGEVLSAEPFAYLNTSEGVDLKTGQIENQRSEENRVQNRARHMSRAARRQGLAALAYSPKTGLHLHPAQQSVHRDAGPAGELHRGHSLRGRERAHVCGPRRQSRRIHGVGSGERQSRVEA